MRKVLLVLSALVMGCSGSQAMPESIGEIRAAFNDEFGVKDSKLTIMFANDDQLDGAAAVCIPTFNLVAVGKEIWSRLGPYQKNMVLYHELLHCEFHIDHVEAQFPNEAPVSIMFPSIMPYFTEGFLRDNWSYYVKQAHTMVGHPGFSFWE